MGLDRPIDITTDQRKTVLALLASHLPNTTAWVYGSRVKWTARPESDLDLVVFATPERDGRVSDLREAFDESNLPFRVDLFVWDDVPEQFRKQIEAEHVVLVESEERKTAMDWQDTTLGGLLSFANGKSSPRRCDGLSHPVYGSNGIIGFSDETNADPNTIIVGRVGTYCGSLRYSNRVCWVTDNAIRSTAINGNDAKFLFYLLQTIRLNEWRVGSGQPLLNQTILSSIPVAVPEPKEQRAIAHILGTLDDKIELNRRMNQTLEEMSRALFMSWFIDFAPVHAKATLKHKHHDATPSQEGSDWTVERARAYLDRMDPDIAALFPDRFVDSEFGPIPAGWEVKPLDEIAIFQNGLALQKYRPQGNEEWLPVVKIAQLRSGKADSGEKAIATIRPECVIEDEDVVFSWSGSLMVRVWCGGRAALNQHLFKVASTEYPKWFFLHCVRSHLRDFQTIAAGKATTMGHIKRHHLSEAICTVPNDQLLSAANSVMTVLLEKSIAANIQSRTLAALRDALLPRLVSGELRVWDSECLPTEEVG